MNGWPDSWPAWVIRDLANMLRRGLRVEEAVRWSARRWAVARRWDEDAKPCPARCGARILERWERAWAPPTDAREDTEKKYTQHVRLDPLGREHACPRRT